MEVNNTLEKDLHFFKEKYLFKLSVTFLKQIIYVKYMLFQLFIKAAHDGSQPESTL